MYVFGGRGCVCAYLSCLSFDDSRIGPRNFPLFDHEQDWQPYPVDPCSAICDDTYMLRKPLIVCACVHVLNCA